MKKNSCTPINPKNYSCYGLQKIHTRNLMMKKIPAARTFPSSPPPPHNFSNDQAHKALYNATLASKGNRCLIRFNKPLLWFTFAINDSIFSFQVRFLWMTTPTKCRCLIESSLSRFSSLMTSLTPWQVCNLLSAPNNTNFYFDVFKVR